MKVHIESVTVEKPKLEFDILGDGTKTNFRYHGKAEVTIILSGKMTEVEFQEFAMRKIMSL